MTARRRVLAWVFGVVLGLGILVMVVGVCFLVSLARAGSSEDVAIVVDGALGFGGVGVGGVAALVGGVGRYRSRPRGS